MKIRVCFVTGFL